MAVYIYDTSYTQNRELSWLKFNGRVLEEAQDDTNPILERFKFLAIVTSNLDEFFMIRVGSLTDLSLLNPKKRENKQLLTAKEQLDLIYDRCKDLVLKRDACFKEVEEKLKELGIKRLLFKKLDKEQKKFIESYYANFVEPIISPQIIDPHHPFPHLENKALYATCILKHKKTKAMTYGIVQIPAKLKRIVKVIDETSAYVLVEDLILHELSKIFKQYTIVDKALISVTRNADIAFDHIEVADEDFSDSMKKLLKKRKRLMPVRLEVEGNTSDKLVDYLLEHLDLTKEKVFYSDMPLDLSYVYAIKDVFKDVIKDSYYYKPFTPQISKMVDPDRSMIEQVLKKDILLFYPYEAMDPYLKLIKEVAYDPHVLSIKITIYRLAKKAKLIKYLCEAAENGKEVTVLMELRARFDEENNINWADTLEESGVRVMYGFENYKVHSKVTSITRLYEGNLQVISQIGTGNYNENTAKMYTDISLITADENIGRDTIKFFNNMAVGELNGTYDELWNSPFTLKKKVLEAIDLEIMRKQMGEKAAITMKLNSITDREVIDRLAVASTAGVKVRLIVRGITCILPGIEGKTENIEISSIVGRFLEHARIYMFGEGDEAKIYISSADMMTRNTEKRVEIAVPIKKDYLKKAILEYLDLQFRDNVKARLVDKNGDLYKKDIKEGEELIDSQALMMQEAIANAPKKKEVKKNENPGLLKAIKDFFSRK